MFMPIDLDKYKQGPDYFWKFAKRIAVGIPSALLGLALLKPNAVLQLFFTLDSGTQWKNELIKALSSGTVPALPNIETLGLLSLVPCATAIGLMGAGYLAVKGLIRKKK